MTDAGMPDQKHAVAKANVEAAERRVVAAVGEWANDRWSPGDGTSLSCAVVLVAAHNALTIARAEFAATVTK